MHRRFVFAIVVASLMSGPVSSNNLLAAEAKPKGAAQAGLAKEVRTKGWIVFSATSAQGDWDLFLMRPDGSARKNITNTSDFHEAAARFAPDGQKILYYRIPRAAKIDNNTYGTFDLVIANADGSNPVIFGKDYPWASWGPKGETLSCLSKNGIQIVDVSTKKIVRALDRKGIFEQLFSSPDGKWLCGTANGLGEHWTIARMDSTSGELNPVSDGSCYNCTPDWFPDSTRIIFSKGIPCTLDYAQLWMANGDGSWEKPDLRRERPPHLRRHGFAGRSVCPFYEIAKGFGEGRQLPDDYRADALEGCSDDRGKESGTSKTPSRKQRRPGAGSLFWLGTTLDLRRAEGKGDGEPAATSPSAKPKRSGDSAN